VAGGRLALPAALHARRTPRENVSSVG
jgi:hypothetical protein